MTIAKRNIKNVKDIRTHSGSVGHAMAPHEVHMRLCVLEMEKARRSKERESALRRVNSIDDRFREIDAEKNDLLHVLADQARFLLPSAIEAGQKENGGDCRSMRGFKLTY